MELLCPILILMNWGRIHTPDVDVLRIGAESQVSNGLFVIEKAILIVRGIIDIGWFDFD